MVEMTHPLSRSVYYKNADGSVRVVGRNHVEGYFNRDGQWLTGERRSCDPAMALWVADGKNNEPIEVLEIDDAPVDVSDEVSAVMTTGLPTWAREVTGTDDASIEVTDAAPD